jgi:hypothetical protein
MSKISITSAIPLSKSALSGQKIVRQKYTHGFVYGLSQNQLIPKICCVYTIL